jgi:hypothetical protein
MGKGGGGLGKHPRAWSLAQRMTQLGKAERAIYGEERLPAGLLISMGEEESRWCKAPWEKPYRAPSGEEKREEVGRPGWEEQRRH